MADKSILPDPAPAPKAVPPVKAPAAPVPTPAFPENARNRTGRFVRKPYRPPDSVIRAPVS